MNRVHAIPVASVSGIPWNETGADDWSRRGTVSDASARLEVSALAQSEGSHPQQVTRNQSD